MKDYKRFTELVITEIPETAKLVVLVGPNGSGKSSVFDAFITKSLALINNYSLLNNYEGYYEKVEWSRSLRGIAN